MDMSMEVFLIFVLIKS